VQNFLLAEDTASVPGVFTLLITKIPILTFSSVLTDGVD